MAEYKGILVCGELVDGKLAAITTEMLGCGRKLADELKEDLSCLLASDSVGEASKEAIAFGADKVYTVEHPALKEYQADSYIQVAEKLAKDISPRIILMGQTSLGRDFAPRLAFRLGTSLTTDCLDLSLAPETKLLVQARPVYGATASTSSTYSRAMLCPRWPLLEPRRCLHWNVMTLGKERSLPLRLT